MQILHELMSAGPGFWLVIIIIALFVGGTVQQELKKRRALDKQLNG